MTKDNLYYYSQTSYTKEQAIQIIKRFVSRKLERVILPKLTRTLEFFMILMCIAMLIALIKGEEVLKQAEEVLELSSKTNPLPFEEPYTVEERFRKLIDSIEVPPEFLRDNTVVEIPKLTLQYTQADVELLAQLMYAEEGIFFRQYSENPEKVEKVHKLAGSVVIHRAEISYRGENTIKGTIYCKGQYAQQTLDRVTEGQDIPKIVYIWAEELLTEGALGPKGLIYQAEFEQGDQTYDKIGNQYFCIETKYN